MNFELDQVKSSNIKDSFIALELCGWLTTGLEEKKNVSVLMRSNIPMKRKWNFEYNSN